MVTKRLLTVAILSATLSACGGGGSDSTPSTPFVTDPTWIQGVFSDESNFKNRCENPRSGTDINNNAYPDMAGSKLHEKHWLRSWSNNTYLWYDEIVDSNPATDLSPEDYFETLKTNATTASGTRRDKYHYPQSTEDYLQLTSAGGSLGYGARFKILKTTPPREGRVAYVEPNSPAADAGLTRGAEIIEIDGVNMISGSDFVTLNKGLQPSAAGEKHTFVFRDLGQTTTRTVVLEAEVVTAEPVKAKRVINTASGKVGYLALNTFGTKSAEAALINAFTELSNESLDDLVLDLRYNGGGYLAIAAQLGYMIAGPTLSNGKVFEKTVFNNKHPSIDPRTGNAIRPIPFIDTTIGLSTSNSTQALPTLNLNRVYVLSSSRTCSASEALINGLKGIDVDVVMIGDTTCGKPYGFYPTDNCGVTYSTIQFRGENAEGFGDYADGFVPNNANSSVGARIRGCQVTENILNPLGDAQEVMLKAALDYRETSICPAVPAQRPSVSVAAGDLTNDPYYKEHELREQIRMDHLRLVGQ